MEAAKVSNDANETRDTYRVAYIIHFLLGVGNLLPWNAFITAVDYYAYLYPTNHIEKVFSVAYMISSVVVLLVMMSWGGWSKTTLRLRMNLGYSMFVISLMVTPVIDWASSSTKSKERSCGLTVAAVVICGLADGLVAGSLIGSAGKLPKQYMQAVFAGTASSGTRQLCALKLQFYFPFSITNRQIMFFKIRSNYQEYRNSARDEAYKK